MTERRATRAVRAGRRLPPGAGEPTVVPLVQSAAFSYATAEEQDAVFAGDRIGYVYGRYGTPTTAALETALAELDGVAATRCFVSGMSAIHALVTWWLFGQGAPRRLVAQEDAYGQTLVLFERLVREEHADVVLVDVTDSASVECALGSSDVPALLFVESIANPLLRVADVSALAALARGHHALLAVDATFATPILTQPVSLGADVVVHSLTKYLNGHGDVQAGSVGGGARVLSAMGDRRMLDGAYLPPHDAWLALRGLRTLALRMERHCDNAMAVARHLAAHPKVSRVHYPGLEDHPQHALAARQFEGRFGGMVSFVLRADDRAAAFRFLDALDEIVAAPTMGDVATEVLYPAISSHRRMPPAERARLGITDGFVRISVGIEDARDIIDELDRALGQV